MNRNRIALGTLVAAIAVAGLGWGLAAAGGGDDEPLTGITLERASAATLAHTGGGTVVETEVGDDGDAYDVEVRLPGGRVVEVNLDAGFNVIGQEDDDDGPGDEDGDD